MLNREIYLIAGQGNKLGEFLVELNFDQPGILSALSNIFAEHDVNIVNIAVDGPRRNLHFIVDLSTATEEQIGEILKQLEMFAFVKRAKYRVSNAQIFVPRWITHVINGSPAVALEKEFVPYFHDVSRLAEEIAKRDAKTVRELAPSIDAVTLEEALYIVQLRGLAAVKETTVAGGRLTATLCNLAQTVARRYTDALLKELGIQYRIVDEGACIRIEA